MPEDYIYNENGFVNDCGGALFCICTGIIYLIFSKASIHNSSVLVIASHVINSQFSFDFNNTTYIRFDQYSDKIYSIALTIL